MMRWTNAMFRSAGQKASETRCARVPLLGESANLPRESLLAAREDAAMAAMPDHIPIPMPGGLDVDLPQFVKVRQHFANEVVADVDAAVAASFAALPEMDLAGKRIAIGVGSRGIGPQPGVVRAVINELKKVDAVPFIVPTMGSHGGGTVEGQLGILTEYGITEESMGVPIEASMDVVQVGTLSDGWPVYCDRIAYEADYIVPCNRVKPHTDFRGTHESGLVKMMAIGLAKHKGAEALHRQGFARFAEVIPESGKVFLDNTKTLFGTAMVENAFDQLMHVELVARDNIFERDRELLKLAKANIPRFHFEAMDLLIVDQIGKNISGSGMDPNATGRPNTKLPGFDDAPDIHRIVVRDLTDATHGNATGLGGADVTTQRVVRKMDWTATYVNVVTSGIIDSACTPLVANTDREAIALALRGCPKLDPMDAKIVRIKNTLSLSEVWASAPLLEEIKANEKMDILGDAFDVVFDDEGTLLDFA